MKRLVPQLALHLFVASFGFVYLYPFLYMVANAFMSTQDVVNPLVRWIPTGLHFDNFAKAWDALDVWTSLPVSVLLSSVLALAQTASSAVIGYGLARFQFRGRRVIFALVLVTIVVAPAITLIPRYMFFDLLGMVGTPLPLVLPALFGQGINAGIFILIFYQFFRVVPRVLDEAAEIDGAGKLQLFLRIAVPVSTPAIVVSLIF
ncbi:MAG: carbohydrate ABC transporter permease, partial [Verrucomicrobiota bacterium]